MARAPSPRRVPKLTTNLLVDAFIKSVVENLFWNLLLLVAAGLAVLNHAYPHGISFLVALLIFAIALAGLLYGGWEKQQWPKAGETIAYLGLAFVIVLSLWFSAASIKHQELVKKLQQDFVKAALTTRSNTATNNNVIRHTADLARQVTEVAHQAPNQVCVELYAHDPAKNILEGMPCCSPSMHPDAQWRKFDVSPESTPSDRGIAGHVFFHGRPLKIDNVLELSQEDDYQYKVFGDGQDFELGKPISMVCCPVYYTPSTGGKVIVGVVCFTSPEDRFFNDDDVITLETLALAVAPALAQHAHQLK